MTLPRSCRLLGVPLCLVFAALWLAPKASAAILDSPWTAGGTGTVTLDSDGSAADPKFHYQSLDVSSGAWTFNTVAASARSVPVDYEYSGFNAFFQVTVSLQRFVQRGGVDVLADTLINDGPADCCTPPSGGFDYTGSTTFPDLQPGDVYGFRLTGSNGDANQTLSGTLVLHEVDATAPDITSQVTGVTGNGGFYTGPVSVKWTVTENDSRITSQTGCQDATVSNDTAGTNITCSATSHGGTTTKTVTIKKDSAAPELTTPAVVVVQGTGADGAIVSYSATAHDGVDPNPAVACTPGAGARFPVGTTSVSCTATDAAGNQAAKAFDVIVLPPQAKPPSGPSRTILNYRYVFVRGNKTRLSSLQLRNVPTGATVTVACKGRGCPKALKGKGSTLHNKRSTLNLSKLVKRPLVSGTKLVIVISSPTTVKTIKTLVIRKGKAPQLKTTCLRTGAKKPTSC
jgi:hypothetical protein